MTPEETKELVDSFERLPAEARDRQWVVIHLERANLMGIQEGLNKASETLSKVWNAGLPPGIEELVR